MKTKRQYQVLNYLIQQQSFVTSDELAKICNVSSRTIKNDLKELSFQSEQNGYSLLSSSKGYQIEVFEHSKLMKFLNNQEDNLDFNSRTNRLRYIIMKLLTSANWNKVKLSQELNISESTLYKDLTIVKEMLQEEDITLIIQANEVLVIGSEEKIRKCITKYIDLDYSSIYQYIHLFSNNYINKDDISLLSEKFIEILHKNNVEIIGVQITNILIHVVVSIYRIKNGFHIIQANTGHSDNDSCLQQKIAHELAEVITNHFNVDLSIEEQEYFKYCFIGKGFTSNYYEEKIREALEKTFHSIKEFFGIEFELDRSTISSLYFHTCSLFDRLRNGITVDQSIVKVIREQFVLAYEMAILYQRELTSIIGIAIPDEEVCYLTVHFGALIEQYKQKDKVPKVVVVTELNNGHVLLLKSSLQSYFGNRINLVSMLSPYEIKKLDSMEVDIILTTENIELKENKKLIKIPCLLDNKSLRSIEKSLNQKVSISELFSPKYFKALKENVEAKECLEKILDECEKHRLIDDAKRILELTLERERIQSTKFNEFLALPHPIIPKAKHNFIYVVAAPGGIKWFDGSVAKLVLFIGIKREKKEEVRSIFDVISAISSNAELIIQLSKAKDYDEFINNLQTATINS